MSNTVMETSYNSHIIVDFSSLISTRRSDQVRCQVSNYVSNVYEVRFDVPMFDSKFTFKENLRSTRLSFDTIYFGKYVVAKLNFKSYRALKSELKSTIK